MKVGKADKILLEKVLKDIGYIVGMLGTVSMFYPNTIQENRVFIIIICIIMIIGDYSIRLYLANKLKTIMLKMESKNMEITVGDIFEQSGLKVINFNEYFDTQVDNKVISQNSLNGYFLQNKLHVEIKELDKIIKKELNSKKKVINEQKLIGKKCNMNLVKWLNMKIIY